MPLGGVSAERRPDDRRGDADDGALCEGGASGGVAQGAGRRCGGEQGVPFGRQRLRFLQVRPPLALDLCPCVLCAEACRRRSAVRTFAGGSRRMTIAARAPWCGVPFAQGRRLAGGRGHPGFLHRICVRARRRVARLCSARGQVRVVGVPARPVLAVSTTGWGCDVRALGKQAAMRASCCWVLTRTRLSCAICAHHHAATTARRGPTP